jgi:hypothetical protein
MFAAQLFALLKVGEVPGRGCTIFGYGPDGGSLLLGHEAWYRTLVPSWNCCKGQSMVISCAAHTLQYIRNKGACVR